MNIFQDPTKSIPKSDGQIVRVNMESSDIGGRKSNLPSKSAKSGNMSITHVGQSGPMTKG